MRYPAKKYYKWVTWTQPVLTSDGSIGGSTFGCNEQAYYEDGTAELPQRFFRLFDGVTGQEWQINTVSTTSSYWGLWFSPVALRMTGLQFTTSQGAYSPASLTLYVSNDGSTWNEGGTATSIPSTNNTSFTVSLTTVTTNNTWKYFKILVVPRSAIAVMLDTITITAQQAADGTADDYDFYEKDVKGYLMCYPVKKCYKWVTWTQPVLTSDTDYGKLTSSSNSNVYRISDNNTSTWFELNNEASGWINWKFPQKMLIKGLTIQYRPNETDGTINQGSVAVYTGSGKSLQIGSTLTFSTGLQSLSISGIPTEGIETYNLFFVITGIGTTGGYLYGGINEVTITAQQTADGTADDYDFYEEDVKGYLMERG